MANLDRQTGLDKWRRPPTAQEKGARQTQNTAVAQEGKGTFVSSNARTPTTHWRLKERGVLNKVQAVRRPSLPNEGMRSSAIQVKEARARVPEGQQ